MAEDSSGIFVAESGHRVFVRIVGRGTYRNAQPLRQFGQETIATRGKTLHVDLSRCQGMDSTFLGVLAGFGLKFRKLGRNDSLHLFNAGERNLQLCQSLGLDGLARIESGTPTAIAEVAPPGSEFRVLPDSDLSALTKAADKDGTASLMLEAHEDLCSADERNEEKFRDVKRLLREEIDRKAGPNQAGN
jgi:anti-anti-sigma regulatory factor